MPRAEVPRISLAGNYAAAGVQVVWTAAAPTADQNFVRLAAGDILLVRNPTAGSLTVTIVGVADPYQRTANMVQAIPAGQIFAFGPFHDLTGWLQADNSVHLNGSAVGLEYAVLRARG